MGQAPQTDDPTVVSAFHSALAHQGLLILVLLALLAIGWNVVRTLQYRRVVRATAAETGTSGGSSADIPAGPQTMAGPQTTVGPPPPEAVARRVLRVGFGALWICDALLQLQSAMPLGMPGGVLQPAAASSRGWTQAVVNFGVMIWERHPVQAAAAAVWIQLGIGFMLLVASRGRWSRIAGLASVAWGLVVWVFGEAFGGIFAPGVSWLFGAPGSALLYVVAGALVALPERSWRDDRLGRRIVFGTGSFFCLMALLQAWPGRGFWQGHRVSGSGTLAQMLNQMGTTAQPHAFFATVSAFERLDDAHGWAVNLVVVVALGGIGALLCSLRTSLVKAAVIAGIVVCLADWVLVQDLGVFGGTGTDPNSMLPTVILLVVGYLAISRVAASDRVAHPSVIPASSQVPWWARISARDLVRGIAALGAVSVVLVGAVPMAFASVNQKADPIVSEATDGTPNPVDIPAPGFELVDQSGKPVSLSDLRGRVIALTFLDPVCTSDCPVIAQEFREASASLGAESSKVELVAVVTNQLYRSVAAVDAFDRQEGLDHLPNWLYLTGTDKQLESVWNAYGIQEQVEPGGAMVAHSELAYVIDGTGKERVVLDSDPSPGSAGMSSFVVVLSTQLRRVLQQ
jgi:cytochrome oxidase Cu insertion factor (SCO1/SenC/PrrC family)